MSESRIIYNDEDNAPMNEDAMPGIRMDWKRYSDIIAEMQKEEPVPFTDPPSEEERRTMTDELP